MAEERLQANCIFQQKKSEMGEQNRMFADIEKWNKTHTVTNLLGKMRVIRWLPAGTFIECVSE